MGMFSKFAIVKWVNILAGSSNMIRPGFDFLSFIKNCENKRTLQYFLTFSLKCKVSGFYLEEQ